MAKLRKGDRVCALLVCNKWGVDLTCFVGTLKKIEKRGMNGELPAAVITVDKTFFLYGPVENRKEHDFELDARLWKILPWTKDTRTKIKEVRTAARVLDQLTRKVRAL
jgi:hypothetical protein